jgi:hypothetical protein
VPLVEDPSVHEVGGAEAHTLEQEDEYDDGTADAYVEEPGPGVIGLDSERVHSVTEAGEEPAGAHPERDEAVTEYEDYVRGNEHEDDADEFGDDLPEEVGGSGKLREDLGHDGEAREQEIWEAVADNVLPTFIPNTLKEEIEHSGVDTATKSSNDRGEPSRQVILFHTAKTAM